MINLGAEIFTKPQKTGAAFTRPKRAGVTGGKATNTTTEKVLIGVRETFQIYDINIPELEKTCAEISQE